MLYSFKTRKIVKRHGLRFANRVPLQRDELDEVKSAPAAYVFLASNVSGDLCRSEIHNRFINPFPGFLWCRIQFFCCEFAVPEVNPFKHHQVEIKN